MKFKKKMVSRIKELREESNISQQELAELVGVSRQTIYYMEKGSYNPSLTLSFKIAEIFNRSIEDIFFFEPEIKDVLGNKTFDETLEISKKSGVSLEKLALLKEINDKQLSKTFTESELEKVSGAIRLKFEDLFFDE